MIHKVMLNKTNVRLIRRGSVKEFSKWEQGRQARRIRDMMVESE